MGGKKKCIRDVRFFHGALQFHSWRARLADSNNDIVCCFIAYFPKTSPSNFDP